MHPNGRRHAVTPKRQGIVLIWTVLLMMTVIGFVAMACDLGYITLCVGQLQNAADAASLAGAAYIQTDANLASSQAARIAAANTAARLTVQLAPNPGNGPAGDVVLGVFDANNVFTPTTVSPNAVKVTARLTPSSGAGPVNLVFGPLMGLNTASLTRSAIAVLAARSDGNAGIIVLNPHAPASLNITGYGTITEIGGDVQVNSDSVTAMSGSGYGTITAGNVDVVGDFLFTGNPQVNGQLNLHQPVMDDPLASLPAPAKGADLGTINLIGKKGATLNPGYYSGGITLAGQGAVTLNPGVYVLDGAGLNLTGSGAFTANGVTIYITGAGALNLSGNGAVHITPPDPAVNAFSGADTYQGVSIFQNRTSTRAGNISGNGNLHLDGVIYAPAAGLTLSGYGDTIGAMVITDTLLLTGNGVILVNRATGHVHPLPRNVYLAQ